MQTRTHSIPDVIQKLYVNSYIVTVSWPNMTKPWFMQKCKIIDKQH